MDAVIVDRWINIRDNAAQNLRFRCSTSVDSLGPRSWDDTIPVGRPLGITGIGWTCANDSRAVGFFYYVGINDCDFANAKVSERLDAT